MDNLQRLRDLRRMQTLATGLLILAGIVFVLASIWRDAAPWVPFVRAFAEAAMVGAFADWFAVTALFRHPLGLPIPHTAIVPARKASIAAGFGRFIGTNIFNSDQIIAWIRQRDPARRLAQWLREPGRSEQVADVVTEALGGVLRVIDDKEINQELTYALDQQLEKIPIVQMAGQMLGRVWASIRQRDVLQQLIRWLAEVIATELRHRVASDWPEWVAQIFQRQISKQLSKQLQENLQRWLCELRETPNHPLYQQLIAWIDRWIVHLQFDPQVQQQAEKLKHEFLSHPMVRALAETSWQELKLNLINQSESPSSALHRWIADTITRFADLLDRDPEWRLKFEHWLAEAIAALVRRYGHAIGEFVTQTVNGWDTAEVTRKIELQFGRDLQFIRINGTIVGGLVGLMIYSVSLLFT